MKSKTVLITLIIAFATLSELLALIPPNEKKLPLELSSKPYARYWWFASTIKEEDVRYNLDWLKTNGFGGVELAWVYPLSRFNKNDTSYTPRQEWLSPEWTKIVDFAVRYADSIGLGCDLTFGTLWPFGDTYVPFEQATQRFGDSAWRQEISRSWQYPKVGYVIDHLTRKNYFPYFERLLKAFPRPDIGHKQSYFIDSWEVETERLWSDSFSEDFINHFGYDISPYMDSIYAPYNKEQLYDYMSLLSDKVLRFYSDYDSIMNANGIMSRGQVSGAPCDLISGYSILDIPEGESMLFEPEFCAIPASAAYLSGKNIVTSETFTCIYGWPGDYIREEQTADLKLVADALFANGINHVIWHGKAHNPNGLDTAKFYATTHIGSNSLMAEELPGFNKYLETISAYMKKGATYCDVAVYLPTEDAWTAGVMPKEKQFKWAWGYYEMRYIYFPDELAAYNPIWINGEYLGKAKVINGLLNIHDKTINLLYINAEYLDIKVVKRLSELSSQGLKIVMKRTPKEPGKIKHTEYQLIVDKLLSSPNITSEIPTNVEPFINGDIIPRHWSRQDGQTLYLFFPNPNADKLKFPMGYGQSLETETKNIPVEINYQGKKYSVDLKFEPYQSLLYKLENDKIESIDIRFTPKTPIVKERPADYKAPWLIQD